MYIEKECSFLQKLSQAEADLIYNRFFTVHARSGTDSLIFVTGWNMYSENKTIRTELSDFASGQAKTVSFGPGWYLTWTFRPKAPVIVIGDLIRPVQTSNVVSWMLDLLLLLLLLFLMLLYFFVKYTYKLLLFISNYVYDISCIVEKCKSLQ